MDIRELLEEAVKRNASDLHLVVGNPPSLRIDGRLTAMDLPKLIGEESKKMIFSILNDVQREKFEREYNNKMDIKERYYDSYKNI